MANLQISGHSVMAATPPFRLLDLPPELWTRIIKIVVTKDILLWHCVSEDPIDFGIPPIAQTCRAIRSEALNLYYKNNVFAITGSCDMRDFISSQKWIQSMIDQGRWELMQPALISVCCGAESFYTGYLQHHFPGKKVTARKLVEPIPKSLKTEVEKGLGSMPTFFGVTVNDLAADEDTATMEHPGIVLDTTKVIVEVELWTDGGDGLDEEVEADQEDVEEDGWSDNNSGSAANEIEQDIGGQS